jgi:hypothetical protein
MLPYRVIRSLFRGRLARARRTWQAALAPQETAAGVCRGLRRDKFTFFAHGLILSSVASRLAIYRHGRVVVSMVVALPIIPETPGQESR